jgi:hypothetical protein
MSKPVKVTSIDLANVGHEPLKVRKNDSKNCRMTYNRAELRMQTPKAKVPFGLTTSKDDPNNPQAYKKYTLEINIGGTPELDTLKNVVTELDEMNVAFIAESSEAWWGKKFTPDSIADLCYGSMVKPDKKGEYPDRWKIKLPFYNGIPKFKVYDQNNKAIHFCTMVQKVDETTGKTVEAAELDWSWAQQQMQIEAICECEGLWVVDRKVYCTWKALQLRVFAPEALPECAFDDGDVAMDETAVEEDEEVVAVTEGVSVLSSGVPDKEAEYSDDDLQVESD